MSVVSNGLKHVNSRAVAGQMPCTDLLRQQVTGKEESFVFYDSGEGDPDRIRVFATPGNLNLLRKYDEWFVDGTFEVCPEIFHQLYTIHVNLPDGKTVPLLFCLLPSKASETYRRLLESIVGALNGSSPRLIHIDFEVAMIKERYGEDPDFALQVRMFSALSFVPTRDLLPVYDSLLRSDFVKDNNYMLTPFINYFESTWVGRERSKPRMKHEWWNVHSSVLEGIARTNNAVEAWNSAFSERVGSSNPNLFRFVEILITEQAKMDFMVNNCLAQGSNTVPKKRYRDRKKRLENLVSSYDQRGTLDLLEAIAHNISF
ncbi:uncharacterized protein LOC108863990 [Galendromus occidentalis]|uniref:Uncharacterized protein LOC108863990 n=1 Tax=Galendromus occidentalis TaxID=34638 RepID=A0AAJ7L4P3_9ACAR|nr:uncharacterized protein LOC108863990 [Galendromus occidentalis]